MPKVAINPNAVVQEVNLSEDSLKFCVPSAICIAGPSQSGGYKNIFTKLLRFTMKVTKLDRHFP